MRTIAILAATALLGACATPIPTQRFNSLSADKRAVESTETKSLLDEDFQAALALCDTTMASAREKFDGSGKMEIGIATLGIIAGSIVVPALAAKTAAAKSAIAGWGGVAGAANAAQYTLQQKGASASRLASVYEETRKEIRSAAESYAVATTNINRVKAITKLSIACRYPQLPGAVAPSTSASGPTT